jgi:hypothetical protein
VTPGALAPRLAEFSLQSSRVPRDNHSSRGITMSLRRVLLMAAVAAAGVGAAGRAEAQYGYGCAGGYGGFGAWDVGRLYSVLAENVPYYAAFPPVYYSVPVPRTYGYSPFAYPPGVMTPEVVEPAGEPLSIINPYYEGTSEAAVTVEGAAPATAPADQTTRVEAKAPASGPQLIINPYVTNTAIAGR